MSSNFDLERELERKRRALDLAEKEISNLRATRAAAEQRRDEAMQFLTDLLEWREAEFEIGSTEEDPEHTSLWANVQNSIATWNEYDNRAALAQRDQSFAKEIHEQTEAALAFIKAQGIVPTMTADEVLELTRGNSGTPNDTSCSQSAPKSADDLDDNDMISQVEIKL